MTSRTNALRYPEGTTSVGTARVREDTTVGRSFAERELMRRTGNAPHSTFDEVADGISESVKASAAVAAQIGQPAPLGKAIKRLTKPAGPAKAPECRNEKGVKRIADLAKNFWGKVDRSAGPDGCWPWTERSKDTSGYGRIRFDFGAGFALRGSHQVAFFLTYGRMPAPGLEVLHSCDNKPCCNPRHLSEGTHSQNMKEAYARGRLNPKRRKGMDAPSARLTEDQVIEIRRLAAGGASLGELSAAFGLSKPGIHHVVSRRTWRHL